MGPSQLTAMAIPFTCPHCGLETDVDERYRGLSGPCHGCGRAITIPSADDTPDIRTTTGRYKTVALFLVAALLVSATLVLLAVLLWPVVYRFHQASLKASCQGRLNEIAMALLRYHADHGHFPPAYTVDDDGVRMHSWRVLILPYLGPEAQAIYQSYDLTKPWNAPENSWLATRMPGVYACPADSAIANSETSYVLVIGDATLFSGSSTVSESDLLNGDGTAEKLALVECTKSGINWLEPRDLDATFLAQGINTRVRGTFASRHPGGAHAVTADGHVHFLDESTHPEDLRAAATLRGGKPLRTKDEG